MIQSHWIKQACKAHTYYTHMLCKGCTSPTHCRTQRPEEPWAVQISTHKKKLGVMAPKRLIGRLRRDNELFRSYMHQARLPASHLPSSLAVIGGLITLELWNQKTGHAYWHPSCLSDGMIPRSSRCDFAVGARLISVLAKTRGGGGPLE